MFASCLLDNSRIKLSNRAGGQDCETDQEVEPKDDCKNGPISPYLPSRIQYSATRDKPESLPPFTSQTRTAQNAPQLRMQ